MRSRNVQYVVGAIGIFILLGASIIGWQVAARNEPHGSSAATADLSVVQVADKVRPATVLVLNLTTVGNNGELQGGQGAQVTQGAGTGFIYDAAGYIVTNNHVVAGAEALRVTMPPPDNRSFDAKLLGADPQTDLAVLKIEAQDLPTVPLGSSGALKIGEEVVAIGNALALPGGPTVTTGVVSATGRDAVEPGETPGQTGPTLYDLIQTDAAINPGNSGGPLVNLRGEVVGINTLGTTDAQGIGFAISIDGAKTIIDQLRQNGVVTRGYLGIQGVSVTPTLAAAAGLSRTDGVAIVAVVAGGPAAAAGLREKDVIFKIGETEVKSQKDLQLALQEHYKPGQTVPMMVDRAGATQTLQVTLGERPH
jgi:serine protease Do